MRILLLAIGAIAVLGTVYALITTVGMPEGTRAAGLVAMFAQAAVATLALGLYGVLGDVERLREQVDQLLEAAKPAPAPAPAVAATDESPAAATARATAEAEREAAALMKTAEDHHFAKDFAAAVAVYRDVVARFPDTKAATRAKAQITNLASIT